MVPELLDAGHQVRCLVRTPSKLADERWHDQVEVVKGDRPGVSYQGDGRNRRGVLPGSHRGWYVAPALERAGLIDKIVGGVGTRRGRRHPDHLGVGDAVDFWRVEAIEPDHLVRLRAEMKLPGEAWIEWRIEADPPAGPEWMVIRARPQQWPARHRPRSRARRAPHQGSRPRRSPARPRPGPTPARPGPPAPGRHRRRPPSPPPP